MHLRCIASHLIFSNEGHISTRKQCFIRLPNAHSSKIAFDAIKTYTPARLSLITYKTLR